MEAPAKPSVVARDRYSVTLEWSSVHSGQGDQRPLYTLQRYDRARGWTIAYWGYKNRERVEAMGPGECVLFRLRVSVAGEHSPWSDSLAACAIDDQVPAVALERAVMAGKSAAVSKILAARPGAAEVVGRSGLTPLMQASLRGDPLTASLLLTAGADANSAGDGAGRTPLMLAAARGHLEICHLLLERGASWDVADRSGCTALHYAVDGSHLQVVKLALDQGANIESTDRQGWTPLIRGVCTEASLAVLELLVQRGARLDVIDRRGQTALMQAVLAGRRDAVQLLLRAGADASKVNHYHNTALDMARARNLKEIIPLLLPEEDCIKRKDKEVQDKKEKISAVPTSPLSRKKSTTFNIQ